MKYDSVSDSGTILRNGPSEGLKQLFLKLLEVGCYHVVGGFWWLALGLMMKPWPVGRRDVEEFWDIDKKKLGEGSYGTVSKCSNKSTGADRIQPRQLRGPGLLFSLWPNGPKMVPKLLPNSPETIAKWSQLVPKCSNDCPKVVSNMVPTLSQNCFNGV